MVSFNKLNKADKMSFNKVKEFLNHLNEDRTVDSWHIVKKIAIKFYKGLDTPISRTCLDLIKHDNVLELINLTVSPNDYWDLASFADDYAAVSLLKKYEGFPKHLKADTRRAAYLASVKAEQSCYKTQLRLRQTEPSRFIMNVLLGANKLITDVLQKCPTLDSLLESGVTPAYGPGASSSCSGSFTSVYNKLSADLHVTAEAAGLAKTLLNKCPRLIPTYPESSRLLGELDVVGCFSLPYDLVIVPGNKFTTVPKTAKTDRPICIEPHLNMVMQKLYGGVIRNRLKRFGIDLSTQHLVNVKLAKRASIDGSLATIDLSNASDSISTELVRNLLPDDWFVMLNSLRSVRTDYDGEAGGHTYWDNFKFSSMGNGFTFELESLIFWALAVSTCRELDIPTNDISIYGDDIIAPTNCYDSLAEVLNFCGFELNPNKSFNRGLFRESCGSDYWYGCNIRPYFIKSEVTHVAQLISIANGIRHYASRRCSGLFCDSRFLPSWRCVLDYVRSTERTIGPSSLGDSVIWASSAELPDAVVPTYDCGIWYCASVIDSGVKIRGKDKGSRALTGALMTSTSPNWVGFSGPYGRLLKLVDGGSPMQRLHRGRSNVRKVTRVAVPFGNDSIPWFN